MNILPVKNKGKLSYNIVIDNSLDNLNESLKDSGRKWGRALIISDSNVSALYLNNVRSVLESGGLFTEIESFTFQAGEEQKNLSTVSIAYDFLVSHHFDRHDIIFALGGGVTGDLSGFTAASYLRGIDFVQLPTSLLAMVDSSIGGKTGVDFKSFKNMVGAFYMPVLVYMNLSFLDSLPDNQIRSGLGEIVKHGLIADRNYLDFIYDNADLIIKRDKDTLSSIIKRSCEIKKYVVEKDPNEQGLRAILNFGHTIGHAVEKLSDLKLLHGECVSLGSIAASYLSYKRGTLSKNDYHYILNVYKKLGMMTGLDEDFNITPQDIVDATHSDKKRNGDKIRFITLDGIGKALMCDDVTDSEIADAAGSIIL